MWAIRLLVFVIIALFVWFIYPSIVGAVFVPTPMEQVHRMLEMTQVGSDDVLYDIGSGDGRIIMAAAEKYGARAIGIEIDPIRVAYSRWRISRKGLEEKVNVEMGNFYRAELGKATVVTVYQGTDINKKLEKKFLSELEPGTRVVSYAFEFNNLNQVSVDNDLEVYLYTV
jgi:precorrin-6B methylase 2